VPDPATSDAGATPDDAPTPDGATPDGQQSPADRRDVDDGHDDAQALRDRGREALAREREARREAEKRAADMQRQLSEIQDAGKSEIERAIARLDRQGAELERERSLRIEYEQDIARRELLELKRSIAQDLGIPPEAAHRLQGDDARSLRADAQRYLDERGRSEGNIGIGRGGAATGRSSGDDMNRIIREASGRG
jgi:hypothetical protein